MDTTFKAYDGSLSRPACLSMALTLAVESVSNTDDAYRQQALTILFSLSSVHGLFAFGNMPSPPAESVFVDHCLLLLRYLESSSQGSSVLSAASQTFNERVQTALEDSRSGSAVAGPSVSPALSLSVGSSVVASAATLIVRDPVGPATTITNITRSMPLDTSGDSTQEVATKDKGERRSSR